MIFDALQHASAYFNAAWWRDVVRVVEATGPRSPLGETDILGPDLRAIVAELTTAAPDRLAIESHRQYVDVHVVIEGEERIDVWPISALQVKSDYDAARDVVLYYPPTRESVALHMRAGHFALFLPQDAHRPGVMIGAPARIKKLVFKISASWLEASPAAGSSVAPCRDSG